MKGFEDSRIQGVNEYPFHHHIGLFGGGNAHHGGGGRHGPGYFRVSVTDKVKGFADTQCPDSIAAAPAADARCAHQQTAIGHEGLGHHLLVLGAIQGLNDNVAVLEHPADVGGIQPYVQGLHVEVRVDPLQVRFECEHFFHAHLVDEIKLAVQVRRGDTIEVGNHQPPDA